MLSSPGIGSGLDVNGIVSQLIAIERQPLARLASQEADVQARISGFGQLKNALSDFQEAMGALAEISAFKIFTATSTDEEVLNASADSNAAKGVFSMDVARIAENHRLAADNTFADSDTTAIGVAGDTMTITVGSSAFTVEFGGKTLAEIRNLINQALDNMGVTASILNDDTGKRLILASNQTGSDSALSVSYSGTDPLSLQDLNTDRNGDSSFTPADLDAVFTLEGQFTVTRTSNSVRDVIEGVSLTLNEPGAATVTIDKDIGAMERSVQDFVDAYNGLVDTIKALGDGVLDNDSSTLLSLESELRRILNTPAQVDGSFSSLFEVGVGSDVQIGASSGSSGKLLVDADTLRQVLETDEASVALLFADAEQGFAVRLEALADRYLGSGGIISSRTNVLNQRVDTIEDRRLALERRLDLVEERLRDEFTALDTLISSLQTTSDFLSRQLASLSTIG
jgi:flagellar hook-associated protein 2